MTSFAQSVADEMAALERVLARAYGPRGGNIIIRSSPSPSSNVRVVSSSTRLVPALAASVPSSSWATGLLLSLLQAPARMPSGAAASLFAHLLAAALVRRGSMAVSEGSGISRTALAQALEEVRAGLDCRLSVPTDACAAWERKVALTSAQELHTLLLSTMSAKRAATRCSEDTLSHIAKEVLTACLTREGGPSGAVSTPSAETSPSLSPGSESSLPHPFIVYRSVVGMDPSESRCFEGVLLDGAHLGGGPSLPSSWSLSTVDTAAVEALCWNAYRDPLPAVLITASLAGGLPEDGPLGGEDAALVFRDSDPAPIDRATREALLVLGEVLVGGGVKILFCQRVVHPSLRLFLSSRGVLVMDRLGIANVAPLAAACGATPLTTINLGSREPSVLRDFYGYVGRIAVVPLSSREFIHVQGVLGNEGVRDDVAAVSAATAHPGALQQQGARPCTLLLGGDDEDSAEELRVACEAACSAFTALFSEQPAVVLPGGGCAELLLADVCEQAGFLAAGKTARLAGSLVAAALRDTVRHMIGGCGSSDAGCGYAPRELEEDLVSRAAARKTADDCDRRSRKAEDGCRSGEDGGERSKSALVEDTVFCADCFYGVDEVEETPRKVMMCEACREERSRCRSPSLGLSEVLELRSAKRSAVCAAIRSAITILRIGCAVGAETTST